VHEVRGQVVSVDLKGGQATIAHEDIPGLMPAMTMPFRFEDPAELAKLAPGDRIEADYVTVPGIGPCLRNVKVPAPARPEGQ
jgi:protein SCO1/2